MKNCPFCAEQIQDAAIVCKHCSRDLVTKPQTIVKTKGRRLWPYWVVGALVLLAWLGSGSSGPSTLTAEHRSAVDALHSQKAWIQPVRMEIGAGFVVVDYEVPPNLAIPARTFGQDRLIAIREV